MGPKTVALLWDAGEDRTASMQLAEAIDAGRLKGLPRMGAKQIEKIKQGHRRLPAQRPGASASTKPKTPQSALRRICWLSTASSA